MNFTLKDAVKLGVGIALGQAIVAATATILVPLLAKFILS